MIGKRRRALLLATLATALALALAFAPAAPANLVTPQSGGDSPNGNGIKTLYELILIPAIVIFIGVEATLFYCLFKYRARKGAVAAQIHGNTRLEVGWTVGAALVLVILTTVTFIKLGEIKNPAASLIDRNGNAVAGNVAYAATDQPPPPKGSPSLPIRVDGQQYAWRFQYPGPKQVFAYEEMVVPVGMTVTLEISSDDVAHSWWIPDLGGKADAIPGYINKSWFRVGKAGLYKGQCAELCGRNHANMTAQVRAVPFDEYRAWYDRRAADIEAARKAAAAQRAKLNQELGQQPQGGSGAG